MEIDHIFIFSDSKGREADQLLEFGLTEGSSRVHPGQGTTNRKFYFENFFLEILWVINEKEIQSKKTSVTRLWDRSQFLKNEYSRFGLCLVNSNATDALFKQSELYQPDYFPEGMSIDIITNENYPKLPWTFRLPYRGDQKPHTEPTIHQNGIKKLTGTEFELPQDLDEDVFISHFQNSEHINFNKTNRLHLTLEFDYGSQKKSQVFSALNLTIKY